jgi:5-formyltetrahydrofolate cyclo-ligase
VRNCFVIFFSVDVSAAELTSIAKKNVNRTIMGPQMDLPKSLLDFMIAPLVGVTRI